MSKFQSNSLESRFSTYRQLSGSNYYIIYIQILEKGRKIRFKNDVLFSAKHSEVNIKVLVPVQQNYDRHVDLGIFSDFLESEFKLAYVPNDVLPILVYNWGFAAKRELRIKKCEICCIWLQL